MAGPWWNGLGLVLLVSASLALVVRRRFPTVVALLGAVCAGMYFLIANDNVFAIAPGAIGLYTLARQGYRARAVALLIGCTVMAVGMAVVLPGDAFDSIQRTGGRTGWMVAIMIHGEVSRYNAWLLRQARAKAREAEHARDEAARRRAAEERLRIARDLHDSLTHSISVMNVQSSVALHLLPQQPVEAKEAVGHVRSASQNAMRELRSTLQTLRVSDAEADPSLSQMPQLIDRVAGAGIDVEFRDGTTDLPASVDAAVYRIVQESLTNAVRHSGAQNVWIVVDEVDGDVMARIVDDGMGTSDMTEGLGIRGMRERAAVLGGSVSVGDRPGGGFEVVASLPVRSAVEKASVGEERA